MFFSKDESVHLHVLYRAYIKGYILSCFINLDLDLCSFCLLRYDI